MSHLSVRPLTERDVPLAVDYLVLMPAEDRERMGLANVPTREQLTASYLKACRTPEQEASSFALAWVVDERAVGFSTLKNIERGNRGAMHLHIWDAGLRGQGLGGALFCMSALEFFRRFDLKSIVCEPRAANPMPNRMLQKIGFPLLRSFVGASSELSAICELNSYDILRDVAESYLLSRSAESRAAVAGSVGASKDA